jgi:hypothetical protein
MKHLLLPLIISLLFACHNPTTSPEPHMELGQKISFVGGNPQTDYVIIGYRDQLESKTESLWNNQSYLVFIYLNDNDEVKQAVIHRNAILKK